MDVKCGTQKNVHQICSPFSKVWDAETVQRRGQPEYSDITKMYFPLLLESEWCSRLKFLKSIQAERATSTQSFSPTHYFFLNYSQLKTVCCHGSFSSKLLYRHTYYT